MGRASRADAARHREQVVTATAKLIRDRGSAGVSVQDVMSAANLTHGGFYKHFASKEDLLGVAATAAFAELLAWLGQVAKDFPDHARTRLIRTYLSTEHRDNPGAGCAITALAGDAARAPAASPLRESYAAGVEAVLARVAELGHEAYDRAIIDYATMAGALTLARATAQSPLSDHILQIIEQALTAQR
ncbi:MAG TPA: TetR family transcriptional regulator [Pseudonocardiaceae bacterium]|jgi:TetR/AcrR family transcriptional repressor of nem operon|nr:TetR family transcriptional regulator [Pseudonocardiaceae bacterium]